MGQYQSDFVLLVLICLFVILGFYRVEKKLQKIEKKIDDLGGKT